MRKTITTVLLSIFFAIAIGIHVKNVIEGGDGKPLWWHGLYFITYGTCWWMIFSKNKLRRWIFAAASVFPFGTHLYYGFQHFSKLDIMFWICVLVCVVLVFGFFEFRHEKN